MAHVLVVDDDTIVRNIVCRFLQIGGHHTTQAASGAEALTALDESRPDLVLTDMSMPGMTGLDLRLLARDTHPSLPFIVMSGQFIDGSARDNFDASLEKPLGVDDVLRAVERLVPKNPAVV